MDPFVAAAANRSLRRVEWDDSEEENGTMVLLVRNRVKDIDHWRRVFDEQEAAGMAAGLSVEHVWRSAEKADEVFFILGVEDRARAEAYMATPEAAAVGEEAGAIEGEFWFLEEFPSGIA
ncbi:MAG: hypothetical protein F4112_03375 [Holophagales bacterium]|nr:hypothetical protein [Holophagales bacterium]MYD21807.1 hypothetical protein [Holophagales bacterium]MYI31996.1 hypothetical protein [Holophagales bacterium]